jgi:hypothetical protein
MAREHQPFLGTTEVSVHFGWMQLFTLRHHPRQWLKSATFFPIPGVELVSSFMRVPLSL